MRDFCLPSETIAPAVPGRREGQGVWDIESVKTSLSQGRPVTAVSTAGADTHGLADRVTYSWK